MTSAVESIRLVVASLLAGAIASGPVQSGLQLNALTVPATALPGDCVLTPLPAPSPAPVVRGGVTVIGGTSQSQFPSNPWSGTDRKIVAAVHAAIDAARIRPLPDVPLPARGSGTSAESKLADNIVQAYHAAYTAIDGYQVEVFAVTFDDATLATAPESLSAMLNPPAGVTTRLVRGATVVRISAPSSTRCFSAVRAHVEAILSLVPIPTSSQTTSNDCRRQIDALLEGAPARPAVTGQRAQVIELKAALGGRPYHEAYKAGVELLEQPEFSDDTSLAEIVRILGRPDLMFAGTADDGVELFYNTNGGPLDLSFQQCALIHKAMDTPPHWQGTSAELSALWSKARRSREWWNWYPMTGTITRAEQESAERKNPEFEVDLDGGIFGVTGTLSFVLAPRVTCRGQWSASSGSALVVTRGRLLAEYGPRYFPGAAVPAAAGPYAKLGQAFIECGSGRTIRLEFITGPGTAHGWGIGEGHDGAIYRFTF